MGETRHQTGAARARDVAAALAADGVSAVAGTYVDTAGIARVKAFPVERLEAAATQGIGMSPVFDAFLLDDSITRGRFSGGLMGDLRLFPDLDRWCRWPRSQDGLGHRSTVTRRRASDTPTARAASPPGWPTDLPARACRCAAVEIEWYVDAGTGDELVPATTAPAYGAARIVELSDYCRDVLEALARQGAASRQLRRYAVGQFEVSVAHEDQCPRPTPACWCEAVEDSAPATGCIVVRQRRRGRGRQRRARPHLSLWRNGRNITRAGGAAG